MNGQSERNGRCGLDGASGLNLFLYIDKVIMQGRMIIDLSVGMVVGEAMEEMKVY